MRTVLAGGCHCGDLRLAFASAVAPERMHPRACDCTFCCKHGAAWISDPAGSLRIEVQGSEALGIYRQGSQQAEFLFCTACGALVAVRWATVGRMFAAVNARCLEAWPRFAEPQSVAPQSLGAEAKSERWRALWIPDVELVFAERGAPAA